MGFSDPWNCVHLILSEKGVAAPQPGPWCRPSPELNSSTLGCAAAREGCPPDPAAVCRARRVSACPVPSPLLGACLPLWPVLHGLLLRFQIRRAATEDVHGGPKPLGLSPPETSSVGTVASDPGPKPGSSTSGCELRPRTWPLSTSRGFLKAKLQKTTAHSSTGCLWGVMPIE